MATVDKSTYATSPRQYPCAVNHRIARVSVAATDFDTNGDIVRFFQLPRGAKPIWGYIITTDLDTNGSPAITLSVQLTDGTTTKTLETASTVGQAGGIVLFPHTSSTAAELAHFGAALDTDQYVMQVVAPAAAATGAAGTVTLALFYSVDHEEVD